MIDFICTKCKPNHIDKTYLEALLHQAKVHCVKVSILNQGLKEAMKQK